MTVYCHWPLIGQNGHWPLLVATTAMVCSPVAKVVSMLSGFFQRSPDAATAWDGRANTRNALRKIEYCLKIQTAYR